MANTLKKEKQKMVVQCLVDGNSVRAIERITGVHRDTIIRLMVRLGNGCATLLDEAMRGLNCKRLQVDEIWSFVQKKEKTVKAQNKPRKNKDFGDAWIFVAIDPDTKLVPVHKVGNRTLAVATEFLKDIKRRLRSRIQISTDALNSYTDAIEQAFGGEADYAQIVKKVETDKEKSALDPRICGERYIGKNIIFGKPDPRLICTAHVERHNLTMRMLIRRLTRKTNGFSKKLENHTAAIALYFGYYNFVRVHRTIKTSPAAMAGVVAETWSIAKFIREAEEANERS